MSASPPIKRQISDIRFEDALAAAVTAGNVAGARQIFDQAFWQKYSLVPSWALLKTALLAENREMLRLLVSHDAMPADKELADLREQTRDRYQRYARLLRMAGLKMTPEQMKPYGALPPEKLIGMIPPEWLKVQAALGAGTLIAGGALRDIANGAPVKDVDIFVPVRGIEKEILQEQVLFDVFRRLGLTIHNEEVRKWHEYGVMTSGGKVLRQGGARESHSLPKPQESALRFANQGVTTFHHESVSCWTLFAGPQKTEYNIVFVKRPPAAQSATFAQELLDGFDIGLCQIAYDGQKLVTTPAYDRDAGDGTITLVNPDDGTRKHLERVVKKYPDWTLCDNGRALLATPLPKPWSRGTYSTGPR